MRGIARTGASALVLLAIMFLGSLVLWVGVPFAWLWIASQIQAATDSLGAALGAAFVGVVLSIAAVMALLSRLSHTYRRQRVARGLQDTGHLALEIVVVVSAGITLVVFTVWFFLFAGTSPIPFNLPN
jgi:heme/copper-type cytochrome/quinol oxidase subunit 2